MPPPRGESSRRGRRPVRGGYFSRGGRGKEEVIHPQYPKGPQKKCHEKAEITAMLQSHKSFSLQRLMRDYKEIKNQIIPIPGVSAMPLGDDFYTWHGNIKAIADNIYKGMVLHFEFQFPHSYPLNPPKITLLNTSITHPNVMPDNSICLDMLTTLKEEYKGWKSGYTILSILLQLQTFFFDVDVEFIKKQKQGPMKDALIKANEFKCRQCKHRGSTNPYPEFFKTDNDFNLYKLSEEDYNNLKLQEVSCFHRKTTFKEAPLGLGISVTKVTRTGEIKGVTPCFEFISLKSYTKEKIRVSLEGDRFTYWFPLYFNYQPEKFLPACTKAISMIFKGNTREFKENMIMKVMPKFFNNVVLNIVTEKTHNSSRALQVMMYLYRICIMLVSQYPSVRDEINTTIENFINDEKCRTKEHTPSLGDLLVMISLSSKHKLEEILASYIGEQMDRQILWILNELPELEKLINSTEIDDIRAKVCFKSGLAGGQLLLFYKYFLQHIVYSDCTSLNEFAEKLDKNYCSLKENEIDKHRVEVAKILKIDNYADFYKFLGLTPPSEKDLNQLLKQSFVNSLNKGYHGKDEARFVPEEKEQIKQYLKKYPLITELVKGKELLPANDPKWREMIERFDFVSQFKYQHPNEEISPLSLIRYESKCSYDQMFFTEKSKIELAKEEEAWERNKYGQSYVLKKKPQDGKIIESLNWRQLYIKFYLEEFLKYFSYNPDFKYLYSLLDLVKNEVIHFNFQILGLGKLKSEFNYIRVVLSKLKKLQYLCFTFHEDINIKMLKNIIKGFKHSSKENNEITHLKIVKNPSGHSYSTKDLNLLTMLDELSSLTHLDLSDVSLNINDALRIRNHLYYFKKLEYVDLTNCNIKDEMAKEIADGIMKAKNLEELYLGNNKMNKNLATILYNIAFQPSIKLIDISGNNDIDKTETCTAIYKLLKMSQTIETLIISNISNMNNKYPNEFFYSVGDSNSLINLDLSNSGYFSSYSTLGHAIAFNALKKGSLKNLNLSNTGMNYSSLVDFVSGLSVSEDDHVNWYGFFLNLNIQKSSSTFYTKYYYCNLQHVDFSCHKFESYTNIHDPRYSLYTNILESFISKTKTLEALNFSKCVMNKYFCDLIADALQHENKIKYLQLSSSSINKDNTKALMAMFKTKDKKGINKNLHLIGLDLSLNNFGYSGIELLSKELKNNTTIKYLNLFHNLFDVNGARRLEEALQVNTTIEELDIGYNRLKDLGFTCVMNGIKANKGSKIKYLGVKYNFIKDKCFKEHMRNLISTSFTCPIKKICFKNNNISEEALTEFYETEFLKSNKAIVTDIFDVLYYFVPERLERTVWMNCGEEATINSIYSKIKENEKSIIKTEESYLGIPLIIRKIRGRKVNQKKTAALNNCFIEFMLPNSANRMLKSAMAQGFCFGTKNSKVFKAGTKPDFLVVKKRLAR